MILQSHPSDAAAWTVIAAPRCTLAIPAVDAQRFDGLAERVASDDGFRAVLEALVGSGIASAPPFALVDGDAEVLRVVLRGEASAVVSGQDAAELTVSGSGMATWAERVLEGVHSLRLQVPGSTWTLTLEPASAPSSVPAAVPAAVPASVPASVASPAPAPSPAPAENTLVPSSAIGPVPAASVSSTAIAPAAPAAAPPAAPIEPPPAEEDAYDFLFGSTIYRTQAGVIRIPNPDPERPGDHDGHTMLAEELGLAGHVPEMPRDEPPARPEHSAPSEATVLAPVGASSARPASLPDPDPDPDPVAALPAPTLQIAPALQLERPDGSRESLRTPVLIGRAPSAAASADGSAPPRLITIADDKDISRSHVRVAVEGDAVVVTDLASKNGTVVTLPGSGPRKLRAGEPTVVLAGTLIDLGGGVTFVVRED